MKQSDRTGRRKDGSVFFFVSSGSRKIIDIGKNFFPALFIQAGKGIIRVECADELIIDVRDPIDLTDHKERIQIRQSHILFPGAQGTALGMESGFP